MLLDELAGQEPTSDEALDTLSTIFYVYIATLIPRYVFVHLHKTIDRALGALESGSQPLKWLHFRESDIPKYVRVCQLSFITLSAL